MLSEHSITNYRAETVKLETENALAAIRLTLDDLQKSKSSYMGRMGSNGESNFRTMQREMIVESDGEYSNDSQGKKRKRGKFTEKLSAQ